MKIDLLSRAQLEILNKRGLKYHLQDAEKDYFLAVILAVLYSSHLKDHLIFKGGTALYHCYIEQIRFSKDLDFTSTAALNPPDMGKLFSDFDLFKLKDIEQKKYGLDFSVQYRGTLAQSDTIEVDINTHQKVLLEPKMMEYRNYYGVKLFCPVMDKNEIFSEKVRALNDRARPRDIYDLVMLRKRFGLKIKDGVILLAKKELHRPLDRKRIAENLKISEERFEEEMRELYYREAIKKEEMSQLTDEILEAIE